MDYQIKKRNLIVIAFITLVVIYTTTGGEIKDIINILQNVHPFWLSIAFLCIMLYWFLSALTLFIMLRKYDKTIKLSKVFKLTLTTQFFNGITPFSSGGQPFQIYILSKHSNLELSSITSASIHNFIVYQTVLVFMGFFAVAANIILNIFPNDPGGLTLVAGLGFTLNFLVIITMLIIAKSPKLTGLILKGLYKLIGISPFKTKLPCFILKTDKTVEAFHKDIQLLMSDNIMYRKLLSINVFKMLFYYAIAYFICLAVGFETISIIQATIASAYIMLITSIVPLPGASGGAEAGFLVFFSSFIVGAKATAIMLLWRFFTYYAGLFIGMITFYCGYKTPTTK